MSCVYKQICIINSFFPRVPTAWHGAISLSHTLVTGNVLSVDKNSYSCFEFNFNYKRSKCLTFNKSCLPVLITICVLLSALNRNASIVSFTFGVFNLVFWLLTYCQCPFPCDQYQGKQSIVCPPNWASLSSQGCVRARSLSSISTAAIMYSCGSGPHCHS